MLESQYLDILNRLQSQVTTLGLTFDYPTGNALVPIVIRKHPNWLKSVPLGQLPVIWIMRDPKPYQSTPWQTEDLVLVKYNTSVMVVQRAIQDVTPTTNLDIWSAWDEQVRRLFQFGLQPFIDSCFFAEINMDPPILRDQLIKTYDVSAIGLKIWNVEQRTN